VAVPDVAVELGDEIVLQAGAKVEAVDVLGDHTGEPPDLMEPDDGHMPLVGPNRGPCSP
jgi:hypothetical protein